MPTIPQIRMLAFHDEEIGMGFNSETGLAVGTCLQTSNIDSGSVTTGQLVVSSVVMINTHEQIMESIGFSFDAQGRYGFFSGGAKSDFSKTTNFNSTSSFLVARCIVSNPLKRGHDFALKPTAQELLNSVRTEEFKTAFGDSFVRGLRTGGEFYAVIRLTSVSNSVQSKLAASLHAEANGLAAQGEFKAAFNTANQSENSRTEFTAMMYQHAGTGAEISPTTNIDDVMNRLRNFPAIAKANPASFETEIATYDTLPLPLPTPEEQENFLFALRSTREKQLQYIQTKNDLEFALAKPDFFTNLPPVSVTKIAVATYIKLINATMDFAVRLSKGQISPPQIFDPSRVGLTEPDPIVLERVDTARSGAPRRDVYRRGDRGPGVVLIQQRLKNLGIKVEVPNMQPTEVTVTGKYLGVTAAAVAVFQSMRGLGIDGNVGPQTKQALGIINLPFPDDSNAGLPAISMPTGPPEIHPPFKINGVSAGFSIRTWYMIGDHGPAVVKTQQRLRDLGIAPDLPVDGNYLSSTAEAVTKFQSANNIPVTNGRLFPFTQKAMGLVLTLPDDDALP